MVQVNRANVSPAKELFTKKARTVQESMGPRTGSANTRPGKGGPQRVKNKRGQL